MKSRNILKKMRIANSFPSNKITRLEQNLATFNFDFDPEEYDKRLLYDSDKWKFDVSSESSFSIKSLCLKKHKLAEKTKPKDKLILYLAMKGEKPSNFAKETLGIRKLNRALSINAESLNFPGPESEERYIMDNCKGSFKKRLLNNFTSLCLSQLLSQKGFTRNDYALAISFNNDLISLGEALYILKIILYRRFGTEKSLINKYFASKNTFYISLGTGPEAKEHYEYLLKKLKNAKLGNVLEVKVALMKGALKTESDEMDLEDRKNLEQKFKKTFLGDLAEKMEKERKERIKWNYNLSKNGRIEKEIGDHFEQILHSIEKNGLDLGLEDENDINSSQFWGVVESFEMGRGSVKALNHSIAGGNLFENNYIGTTELPFKSEKNFNVGDEVSFYLDPNDVNSAYRVTKMTKSKFFKKLEEAGKIIRNVGDKVSNEFMREVKRNGRIIGDCEEVMEV